MNKEIGQQLVLENAGTWTDQAMYLLERFLKKTSVEFTMDDFRSYASNVGLNEPHHPNAWGALFNHASSRNLIRFSGNVWESTRPEAHKRLIRGWVRT
jgi:hypothetical protein